jgi:uncharacterized coiled-coil protein SlyX
MPTQEERLSALEQGQGSVSEAIKDLNHYVTMLIGIVQREEWDIREMKGSLRAIDGRLNSLEGRFDMQDKKLDQVLLLLNTLIPKPDQET